MTLPEGVLEEKIANIQKEVDKFPEAMKQLKHEIVSQVDVLLTTKAQNIESSVNTVKDFLQDILRKIEALEKNDHIIELRFKDVVMQDGFENYKKEIREELKDLKGRIETQEDRATFLTGSFATILKVGSLITFILGSIAICLNIYNSAKTADKVTANSNKIERLEKLNDLQIQ